MAKSVPTCSMYLAMSLWQWQANQSRWLLLLWPTTALTCHDLNDGLGLRFSKIQKQKKNAKQKSIEKL